MIAQTSQQPTPNTLPGLPAQPVTLPGGTWGLVIGIALALIPNLFRLGQQRSEQNFGLVGNLIGRLDENTRTSNQEIGKLAQAVRTSPPPG
jgi:hypothetical protein